MKKAVLVLSMLAMVMVTAQAGTFVDGQIVSQKSGSNRTNAAGEFLAPDAAGTSVGVLNLQSGIAHGSDQVTRVAVPRTGSDPIVPEAAWMLLFATGLFGLAAAARRRTTK